MPRFIHSADWQIGKAFGAFAQEDAQYLQDQRIDSVARLAELASQRQVDAVLVAGDVFDVHSVSPRTLRRLIQAMAAFTGPWVLLPGNHDAAVPGSVWEQWQQVCELPDNIHLVLCPGPLCLADASLALLCAPLTQRHSHQDLTAFFDEQQTPPGLCRVGLAHGGVTGILMEQAQAQNPIAADRAERARLDYLALGDWHGYKLINERTAYSGTLEPDRFRDNQPGKVLEVAIAEPGALPELTVHHLGHYHWQEHQASLRLDQDVAALQAHFADADRRSVIRLRLDGQLALASYQQLQQFLEALHARVQVLDVRQQGLQLLPSDEELARLHADGYVAAVIEQLRAAPEEDELAATALKLLLSELALLRGDAV